ncbi:MAG: hypothetical protein AB1331_05900 [Bacillota bacterium]
MRNLGARLIPVLAILVCLVLWPGPVEAGTPYRTEHFIIEYSPDLAPSIVRLGQICEEAYRHVADFLGVEALRPIRVDLISQEFRSYAIPEDDYIKCSYRAGEIGLRKTMAHEITHILLQHAIGRRPPAWLNEGLAEYQMLRTERGIRWVVGDYKGQVMDGLPVPKFHELSYASFWSSNRAYDTSMVLVIYLTEYYGRQALADYIAELARGTEAQQAAVLTYGKTLDEIYDDWVFYLRYQITEPGQFPLDPDWSPVTARYVFSRTGEHQGIWLVGYRPYSWQRISDGNDRLARWAPDGQRLAFVRETEWGYEIRLAYRYGLEYRVGGAVWSGSGSQEPIYLTWLPQDGRLLVQFGRGDDATWVAVDIAKHQEFPFSGAWEGQEPVWSADGKRLAYLQDGQLVASINGGPGQPIEIQGQEPRRPRWSLTGQWLAFEARVDDRYQVFVWQAASGEVQQITAGPGSAHAPLWVGPGQIAYLQDTGSERVIRTAEVVPERTAVDWGILLTGIALGIILVVIGRLVVTGGPPQKVKAGI